MKRALPLLLGLACAVAIGLSAKLIWEKFARLREAKRTEKTVADRVQEFGAAVDSRLAPYFRANGVAYPPEQLVLVGLKKERRLEVYASAHRDREMRFIRSYPILGASGELGPKLREGDYQVPEGLYRIESLNPNSLYHLGLRVNYPNVADRERAKAEGRANPGSDIMIHGGSSSVGCLAMGDETAEDLFILAARTGLENIRLLLCPLDFRNSPPPDLHAMPPWTGALYGELRGALIALPAPTR